MKTGDYMIHVSETTLSHKHCLTNTNLLDLRHERQELQIWGKVSTLDPSKLYSPYHGLWEVVSSEIINLTRFEKLRKKRRHNKNDDGILSNLTFFSVYSDTISPMVTVETCGEKKFTSAKDDVACGSVAMSHWKEHMFFEPRNIVSENFSANLSPGFNRFYFI